MIPSAHNNDLPVFNTPVFNPLLKRLLPAVLLLFFLLLINSVYLGAVTLLEYFSGQSYQDQFYLLMFLGHLVAGLLLAFVFFLFVAGHVFKARKHTNSKAIRAGLLLLISALLLLLSGLILSRFDFFEVNSHLIRNLAYWLHIVTPVLLLMLFIQHRRAKTNYRFNRASGLRWAAVSGLLAIATILAYSFTKPDIKALDFHYLPALTQTPARFIEAEHLMVDNECAECHADIARTAAQSMHRFSSFNNPAYRFSVEEARQTILNRDGNVHAARFCAACHDIVPLLSGKFDDPDYDMDNDATASVGLTCIACHAISNINSTRGNADFTLQDPPGYPFAYSSNPWLKRINHQLIKSKPALHKNNLLKPLHQSAEFCSACHKNHLPVALNQYRWLRGQDHYSSFLFSGVSGHRVDSFYYPDKAIQRCSQCHMPLKTSDDPAARNFDHAEKRSIHSHRFAAANTALAQMKNLDETLEAQQAMLKDSVRVDIFAVREGGTINGKLLAPIRPELPQLIAGEKYLLEVVVRTLKPGHHLTQGTSDSNQLWLTINAENNGQPLLRSGHLQTNGKVDPWAYFVNSYLLDRNGRRIDRRNAADIFVTLYNHQIPPGASSVIHYLLEVPDNATGPLNITARLNYRKFDTPFMRYIEADQFTRNSLPITILGSDQVTLPVTASSPVSATSQNQKPEPLHTPSWERWNDYGIGLLRQGEDAGNAKGELRQAEAVFNQVALLNPAQGYLNLTRVYFQQGNLEEASQSLHKAQQAGAFAWTVDWYAALIERENGQLDSAISRLEKIIASDYPAAQQRNFDFSYDIRVLNTLGRTLFEKSRSERRDKAKKQYYLNRAELGFKRVLNIDPEDLSAHYNLSILYASTDRQPLASQHRELHEMLRPDDNAVAQAVSLHRRNNAAADHAASPIAIYPLQPVPVNESVSVSRSNTLSPHE